MEERCCLCDQLSPLDLAASLVHIVLHVGECRSRLDRENHRGKNGVVWPVTLNNAFSGFRENSAIDGATQRQLNYLSVFFTNV